ncbi:MAG: capsular polysaccharide export protein, partial [Dasania sp.]
MIDVKEKITHLMGALKKKVLQKITIISKKFNKKNENIQYHAVENNYVELYNDRSKFRFFRLIGRNWTKKPQLPVAICWGFNKWKHGFISDYVPDYKTAFASKKSMGIFAIYRIIFLDEKPKMFFIWGYTETFWVRLSAKILNIPISRIEDGFVRSAGLGAEHNTPYSLVIEKEALYYDSRSPSTLENILNHYDFSKDTLYEEQASKTIKLLIENNISKYNLSSATAPQTSLIKLRKKILVIGQVANDAAIRLGNPDKWTIEAIIKLAKEENIDADVLYRPHPEVYKKFQKNRLQTYKIKKYATIVDPEIPLDKFLKDIDHVYLISSLSGVEALIRGVKVTTLGVPFYAGWGLTDDRVYNIPRRDRKISLLQLVYCLYLKYPTYLADPDNGFDGLRITIMRIDADRHIKKLNALPLFDINQSNISKINDTLHLSTLLIQKKNSDFNIDIIRKLNFHTLFNRHYDTLYQKIILNLYFGLCLSDPARKILLSKIRTFIDKDIFNEFLLDIYTHGHKDLALENLAYLANHLQEYEVFDKIESQKSFYKTANMPQELLSNTLDENVIASSTLYAYENKNYNKVIANNLLLFREGIFSLNALNQLIGIAYMTFKNDVAIKLSELSCAINIMAQNRSALGYKIKSYSPTSLTTNINFQKDIIRHITLNSEQIAYALSLSKYFICEKDKEFFKK